MFKNYKCVGYVILAAALGQALPLPAGNTCCRTRLGKAKPDYASPSYQAFARSFILESYHTWRRSTLEARLRNAKGKSPADCLALWGGLTVADYRRELEHAVASAQKLLDDWPQRPDIGEGIWLAAAGGRLELALERLNAEEGLAATASPREEEQRESGWAGRGGGERKKGRY